jgi:hypothetical protein
MTSDRKGITPVPTTSVTEAALWASKKYIITGDGTHVFVPPYKLVDVSVKDVEGSKTKTKMIFWFDRHPTMKDVELAFSNRELLVDSNDFHNNYTDFRNKTFNKGFAVQS